MVTLSEKEAREKADAYNQTKKEKNWALLAARDWAVAESRHLFSLRLFDNSRTFF